MSLACVTLPLYAHGSHGSSCDQAGVQGEAGVEGGVRVEGEVGLAGEGEARVEGEAVEHADRIGELKRVPPCASCAAPDTSAFVSTREHS